jgi:long-chain acyl-CoA synthetase
VLFGQGRPKPVALLCLTAEARPDPEPDDEATLASLRDIGRDISQVSAALPSFQRPAAVLIRRRPFSVDSGELTSNLKLRRKVIEARHKADLEALYRKLSDSADADRSPCLIMEVD